MKVLAGILMMMLSTAATAAEVWHTSTLRAVYPLGQGDFVLAFHAESAACPHTGNPKYYHVTVGQNGVTAEGSKKLYAVALMAMAMGKPVSVAFSDADTHCYINRIWFPD